MMNQKIFVYGTLRTGGYFSNSLVEAANKHLCKVVGVEMYNLNAYPGVIITKNPYHYIEGEVIDYSNLSNDEWESVLTTLDIIEGVDYNLFKRGFIETPYGKALIYLVDNESWFDKQKALQEKRGFPFEKVIDWADKDPNIQKRVENNEIKQAK